ncbi:MAG: hypothetical protein WA628_00735 [Terriglobales bacterium]
MSTPVLMIWTNSEATGTFDCQLHEITRRRGIVDLYSGFAEGNTPVPKSRHPLVT